MVGENYIFIFMSKFESGRGNPTINEAVLEITAMLGDLAVTGAGDTERESLTDLIAKVGEGKITPEEGLLMARTLMSGRQDYH